MIRLACLILSLGFASTVHSALVMHLEFEGDFSDSSSFGNDAVRDSRSVGTTEIVDGGISGSALALDNGLAWLTVADAPSLSPTSQLTMAAWVNFEGRVGNNSGIFFKGELIGQQPDWQLGLSDVGTGSLSGRGLTGANAAINGTGFATSAALTVDVDPVSLNVWTHIAATYDGSVLSLYVDGLLVDTDALSQPLRTTGSPLYIGNRFRPSGDVGGFQGLMDDLRIYDTALAAADIAMLATLTDTGPMAVSEPSALLAFTMLAFGVAQRRRGRAVRR